MSEDDLLPQTGEPAEECDWLIGSVVERATQCRYCGNENFVLEAPKGPHSYGARCENCKRHGGWLSKAETADINKMLRWSAPSR